MVFCPCLEPTTELYRWQTCFLCWSHRLKASQAQADWPTNHVKPHVFILDCWQKEDMMQAEARLEYCKLSNKWCGLGATLNSTKEWKQTRPHWSVALAMRFAAPENTMRKWGLPCRDRSDRSNIESCWNCFMWNPHEQCELRGCGTCTHFWGDQKIQEQHLRSTTNSQPVVWHWSWPQPFPWHPAMLRSFVAMLHPDGDEVRWSHQKDQRFTQCKC